MLALSATARGETPRKVALVPLQVNAQDQLDYLRDGLQDIMASRLAWEGKVVVLDQDPVRQALARFPGPVNETRSQEIGKSLGADVVVYGSLTMIGTGASLDVRVKDLAKNQAAEKFYTETKNLDEVIPRVNDLLEDINAKVFERPRTVAAAGAPAGRAIPGVGTAAPLAGEKPGLSLKDFTLRPLSPQIIVNAGGFDLTGIWRSTILPYALIDLAFGDLDGDGYLETVIISQRGVHVYRFKDDKFNLLTEITGQRNDNYISVDVADIHGTGRPQIFVTNFRNDGVRSLVLSWEGDGIKTIVRNVPYSWRVHQIPGRGQVLLGQQRRGDDPFGTKIKVLSWKSGRYEPLEELDLPAEINIFNFKIVDLNGDGTPETVYLNNNNRLVVLSPQNKVVYQTGEHFGGTVTFVDVTEFNAFTSTIMSDRAGRHYLPSRMVVIPGVKSGTLDLVLNKNKDSLWNILDRFNSFSSGVIYSLSWDGVAFKENWRTMTINDYVANYSVEDFKNIKQNQLVVGVVQSQGLPLVGNARSVIYCYDLGVVKIEKK
ncbi:MAG: FG-GAP-like repeat-containing protein [Desulfobacterota bacterium]|nr:FG-GAP-like repeat-containing protein [Thermodesulfobacteriota bacterium]